MVPVIAIVGRPNVGKSTLFNRLVGQRQALVHDRPGVTRDRHYGTAEIEDREVILIDTGGFEPVPTDDLFAKMRAQAEAAIQEADLILFVVDRQAGLTPADKMTADLLRKMDVDKQLVLVVNKCDGPKHEEDAFDFYSLGLDPMITISAEHGRGIYELFDAMVGRLPERVDAPGVEEDDSEIRIAVIGRPNIGKSTLVNRMIGEDRHVVHDMPGTTMDAVDSVFEEGGQMWRIVDTAGVRRRTRIDDKLETFATARAIRTIERCHISLLMIDGIEGITAQDARLAGLVEDRGRGCVLLINRWDLARSDPEVNSKKIQYQIEHDLPHVAWSPSLFISALTGKGCHRILPTVRKVYRQFDKRIPTAGLNRWLETTVAANNPPQRYHRPVKLNYITQTRVRPPSFVIWSNTPDGVKAPYRRYLTNSLRKAFGFEGTPIRLKLKRKRRPWDREEDLK
ncbi:MAG: ribosome biogenesis GTPase Der [Myxococcota bacterium]